MNITTLPPGYAHGYAPHGEVQEFIRGIIPTGTREYRTDQHISAIKSKAEWIRKQPMAGKVD